MWTHTASMNFRCGIGVGWTQMQHMQWNLGNRPQYSTIAAYRNRRTSPPLQHEHKVPVKQRRLRRTEKTEKNRACSRVNHR
ncbi:hypothetical protein BDA96_03G184000 [Sorghum bicolor]|uniref:Uncharacterized protein n=2 Tax=Sorghum bicolor TaxID=4558 RepID=A0A921UNT4_SORBI|nr:hypothetical protein BDA96_03G184000 [Sorghum bicolor]KXG32564.1 hypothetical protein SORBI_3003G169700 [Sorghum bicolor]